MNSLTVRNKRNLSNLFENYSKRFDQRQDAEACLAFAIRPNSNFYGVIRQSGIRDRDARESEFELQVNDIVKHFGHVSRKRVIQLINENAGDFGSVINILNETSRPRVFGQQVQPRPPESRMTLKERIKTRLERKKERFVESDARGTQNGRKESNLDRSEPDLCDDTHMLSDLTSLTEVVVKCSNQEEVEQVVGGLLSRLEKMNRELEIIEAENFILRQENIKNQKIVQNEIRQRKDIILQIDQNKVQIQKNKHKRERIQCE